MSTIDDVKYLYTHVQLNYSIKSNITKWIISSSNLTEYTEKKNYIYIYELI